jgi:hypothetical protein
MADNGDKPTPDKELEDLERKKKIAELKKEIAEAEKAAAEAGNKELLEVERKKKIAELENEIAEKEKSVAEALKAKREAYFPKGEAKPLEGKIETDEKFGYVAELTAYKSMQRCVETIGKATQDKLPETARILLVDTLDFAQGDSPLIQVQKQFALFTAKFESMKTRFDTLLKKSLIGQRKPAGSELLAGVGTVLFGATSIASLIADLAGYFRSDYNIKGQDFALSDESLRISVAGKISKVSAYMLNFSLIVESDIFTTFQSLLADRIAIENQKNLLLLKKKAEVDAPDDQSSKAETVAAGTEKAEPPDVAAPAAIADWQNLSATFDSFVVSIASVAEGQQLPTLAVAATREQIRKKGITHLLYLKVASGGGEAITRKSHFRSGLTAFLGGCAITYILADTDGRVVAADILVELSQLEHKLGESSATFKKIEMNDAQ